MINNLANPKKKVIALISGIPVDSDPLKKYKAWALIDQLRQFFEVRPQGLTPKITDDVDLLMIVHPFGLSDESKYAYLDSSLSPNGWTIINKSTSSVIFGVSPCGRTSKNCLS